MPDRLLPHKPSRPTLACLLALFITGLAEADSNPETRLLSAVEQLGTAAQLDPALSELEQLLEEQPDFNLARLVYADLLMAKAGALDSFGNKDRPSRKPLADLQEELRMRWRHYAAPPAGDSLPGAIIRLSRRQAHAIIVDLGRSRLYVFANRNGKPALLTDFYISFGKEGVKKQVEGDKKTPLGVYRVTRFIADSKLPAFYGSGAFPIDYPNQWDRRLGRSGYGIWLHGTPWDTYSRPPRASDGCVTICNADFNTLIPFVDIENTPVILTDHIEWLAEAEWLQRRRRFETLLANWQADWESRNHLRYISHYGPDFHTGNRNYQDWSADKKHVNTSKSFIDVELEQLNLFRYPGEQHMFEARFLQHYRSSNFSDSDWKKQYWKRADDGRWQIIYEGPA
ncbi:MAG: L,D-transpeptidase family protein [Granulosicoccaceae bacterium]|jgi:murein L,D-transpeptidase YafK